jgi:hypothetical protein
MIAVSGPGGGAGTGTARMARLAYGVAIPI